MCRIDGRRRAAFLSWCVVVSAVTGLSLAGCGAGAPPPQSAALSGGDQRRERLQVMVAQGDKEAARAYYTETLGVLGLKPDLDNDEPGMPVMLDFLGYAELTPTYLEDTPSGELMRRFGDDLLASAFFAPKITDVSGGDPGKIDVGWRKVIRLRARPGSEAARRGIASGFLLFNKFQGTDHSLDPFEPRKDESNESKTTQLILVRAAKSAGDGPADRPLHFFVYGRASEGAKLKLALQASFDAAAPAVEAEIQKRTGVKDYFVPLACGQCHGGLRLNEETGENDSVDFARQKLNFLDTDHWFDRVQEGDDFAFLGQTGFGVLFDGGKEQTSAQFDAAFDVLRRLNAEIKEQNERVEADPKKPSFQLRAVSRWAQLHPPGDNGHKDLFARALDTTPGAGPAWDRDAEPDRQLLKAMNQYCYRCHSSIIYSVFDRPQVACRKGKIKDFLNRPPGDKKYMPQDRVLAADLKSTLLELVSGLPDGPCPR